MNNSETVAKNIINKGLATPAPMAAIDPTSINPLSILSAYLNNEKNDVDLLLSYILF